MFGSIRLPPSLSYTCVRALLLFANTVSVTAICDRTWQFATCSASFICPCEEIYNLFTLSYWEMCACVPNKLHIWLCVCVCVCVSSVVLWLLSHLLTSFLSPCTSRLSNLLLLISGNWNIFCWCLNLLQCEYKCGTNNSLWSLHVNLSLWSSLECCDYQGIFYFFVCQENSFFYCVHYSSYHHWCFLSEHYKTQICTFFKVKEDKRKAANIWPENEYEMTPYSCQ